jgi:hypothetical protein
MVTENNTCNDVHAFVRSALPYKLSLEDDTKESIASELSFKVQGMFLWIRLKGARI